MLAPTLVELGRSLLALSRDSLARAGRAVQGLGVDMVRIHPIFLTLFVAHGSQGSALNIRVYTHVNTHVTPCCSQGHAERPVVAALEAARKLVLEAGTAILASETGQDTPCG